MDISGWKSIDIYLFTNGQEQSPPRKYHLTDDELEMWDDTLSKLGVSQNGYVNQPIEIYTISGEKISSPMELKNGGTYVSVNLGETFISARYKRYIMKATRSWEKRKVKNFIELPTTKPSEIQEEYGDLGKSNRREVIINIDNLYKQNNIDFSPQIPRPKSPYVAESLPSPDTCNIVDSTLRHSSWFDDVNIHKVQIEQGNFNGFVKKKRYKKTNNSVRSAKSIMNAKESKQSPIRNPAPGLPLKKKIASKPAYSPKSTNSPKSTHSPTNAAKRRKIPAKTASKTSPHNKLSQPQIKSKKSTPSNRSVTSRPETSDTPTDVNKSYNDPLQFASDSEQGKDQQKSTPVKEAAKEAFSENRIGKPPEPRQRWSLNDDVINNARNSRDQTPTPINRNLLTPGNDPVRPYTQPEVRTQNNYILLKPDNTAIIVDENVFKSMSPEELNQYISYGAINKIASLDTNNDRDQPAGEPVPAAPPPALPNDNPVNNRQRTASTSSRKSVNINDDNIQHIPPSPMESISYDEKSISPGPENGKKFSRKQNNSICIQTLRTHEPNSIEVSQGMCTSSYVEAFLPIAINMDLRGRPLYKKNPRNADLPKVGPICADSDYPPKAPGSRYPKCSNLYNVTFNSTERDSPSKAADEKRTVHPSASKEGVSTMSMSPRNVNIPQRNYKSHIHTRSTNVSNSPYKYSNKYDYVPPKVVTRHAQYIPQIIHKERSKSADGRSTRVNRTFSSTSATEIRKRLPQTQSPRNVNISQLNLRHTVSKYTSYSPPNNSNIQTFGSDVASTKSEGNRYQTTRSAFPQAKSSQSLQSINVKKSPYESNFSKSNNNKQQNLFKNNKENMQPNVKSISTSPINTRSPSEKLRNLPQVPPSTPSNAISGKTFPYANASAIFSTDDQRSKSPLGPIPRQFNIPQRPNNLIPKGASSRFTFTTPQYIQPKVISASTSPVFSNGTKTNQSDKRFAYRNNNLNSTSNTRQNKTLSSSPNSPTPLKIQRNSYKAPKRPNEASTKHIISKRKLLSTNNQQRNRIPLRQVNIPQQPPNSPEYIPLPKVNIPQQSPDSPVSTNSLKYLNGYANRLPQSYPTDQIKKRIQPMQIEDTDLRDVKSDFIDKKSANVKHDFVTADEPPRTPTDNSKLNKTELSVDNTVSSNVINNIEPLSRINQSSNYIDQSVIKTKHDNVNNIDLNENVSPILDRPESTRNFNTNLILGDISPQSQQTEIPYINNIQQDTFKIENNVNNSKETKSSFDKTASLQTDILPINIIQQDTFKTIENNFNSSKEIESSFDKTESLPTDNPPNIIQQDTFKTIENNVNSNKESDSSFDKTESLQTDNPPINIIEQDRFKIENNLNNSKETESSFDKTESLQTDNPPINIIQQDTFKTIENNVNSKKETESSFDKTESPQTEIPPVNIIQQDTFKTIDNNFNNSKETEPSFEKMESPQTKNPTIIIIQQDTFKTIENNVINSKETESSFNKTESPQTKIPPVNVIQQDTFKTIDNNFNNSKETESSFDKKESPQIEIPPVIIIGQDAFKTIKNNVNNNNKETESSFEKMESPQTKNPPIMIIQQDTIKTIENNVNNKKETVSSFDKTESLQTDNPPINIIQQDTFKIIENNVNSNKETDSSFDKTESPQTEIPPVNIIQQDTFKTIENNFNNSKETESSFDKTESPQTEISPIIIIGQDTFKSIENNVNNSKETEPSFEKMESPQTKTPTIIIIQQDTFKTIENNVNNSKETESSFNKTESPQTKIPPFNIIQQDTFKTTENNFNNSKETESSFDKTDSPQTEISPIIIIGQDTFKIIENNVNNNKETESFFEKMESPQTKNAPIIITQQDTFNTIENNVNNNYPFNDTLSSSQTNPDITDYTQPVAPQTVNEFQYPTFNNITDQNQLKEDTLSSTNEKIKDDTKIESKNAIEEKSNYIDNEKLGELNLKSIDTKDLFVDTNRGEAFSENESAKRSSVQSATFDTNRGDTFSENVSAKRSSVQSATVDTNRGKAFSENESAKRSSVQSATVDTNCGDAFSENVSAKRSSVQSATVDTNRGNAVSENLSAKRSSVHSATVDTNRGNAFSENESAKRGSVQSATVDTKHNDAFSENVTAKRSSVQSATVDTNRSNAFSENVSAKRSSVQSAGNITPTMYQPISDDVGTQNEITAVVGKGDIFNLKLNLSGKNIEGLITIDKANKDGSPQTMNLNQASQTNLNIMFKEKPMNEETATDVSCSTSESGSRMPNVIVVQCACCENINIEELKRTLPKAFDNYKGDSNKCIVLLPADSKCMEQSRNALSNAYPTPCNDNYKGDSLLPTDSKSIEKSGDTLSNVSTTPDNGLKNFNENCECEIPDDLGIEKTGVHYPEDEVKLYQAYSASEDEPEPPPSATSTPNDNVVKIVPQCTDKSTQTEWKDALLIPVIHEDGHVTFKFPSLETIKKM